MRDFAFGCVAGALCGVFTMMYGTPTGQTIALGAGCYLIGKLSVRREGER